MHSALYFGILRHRRFLPRPHRFSYRLFMVYLDLAELRGVFRGRWLWSVKAPAPAWFRRSDFLGDPALPLDDAVREHVRRRLGTRPAGPVRMLTHLRYFGLSFNPVTFYYCFDATGARLEAIVAEITNTPWNERHTYVLDARGAVPGRRLQRFEFSKGFHVSPFMPMDLAYEWYFSEPHTTLAVQMRNLDNGVPVFDASLRLARREMTASSLAYALLRFPLMSAQVLAGIYLQAFRLYLRGVPVHPHPPSPAQPGHADQNA